MNRLFRETRVEGAVALSLIFNCLLLLATFFGYSRDGEPNAVSRVVEVLGLPAGAAGAGGLDGYRARLNPDDLGDLRVLAVLSSPN